MSRDPDHHRGSHVKNRKQLNTSEDADEQPTATANRDRRHDIFEERHNHRDLQQQTQGQRHRTHQNEATDFGTLGMHQRDSACITRKNCNKYLPRTAREPQQAQHVQHQAQRRPQHIQHQHLEQQQNGDQPPSQHLQHQAQRRPQHIQHQDINYEDETSDDSDQERRQLLVDIFYERHLQEERERGGAGGGGGVEIKDRDTISEDEEQIREEGLCILRKKRT